MTVSDFKVVGKEAGAILLLSAALALIYNAFSANGIPLVRKEPAKVAVSDSTLFAKKPEPDSARIRLLSDTARPPDIKVIAPLHERALANPDSMARVVGKTAEPVYKILSLEQVKRLLRGKEGLFLDARTVDEFRKGHIRGARNIPAEEAGDHFAELVKIPRDTIVVVYCGGPECHLGRMLADFMGDMEFKKLYLYDDGWEGWTKARMPVDSTVSGQ